MLVCPSSIDMSPRTLRFLTGQLTARRREIGTRWRRLPAARQALLALAHLRCGDTYAPVAAGFGDGKETG
ncbi:transposase family protein, partial [Streptomyces anulatus]|uniref:transposase family protein n=1 Tax=Streptomyces anulatus TaxID=1892 RepID=UPI0036CDDAA0